MLKALERCHRNARGKLFLSRAWLTIGFCLALIVASPADDKVVINQKFPITNPSGRSNLSPPHVDSTHECAKTVRVDSFVPHATINVYLKKTPPPNQLIGGPYTSFFGFAGVPLTITLHTGDVILATQTVNGTTSALSAPMVVGAMPNTLPDPDVLTPVFACGVIAPVNKLVSGVDVTVQDKTAGATVGTDSTPNAYFSGAWDPVTVSPLDAPPATPTAHEIRARQSACTGPPPSHFGPLVKVTKEPSPVDPPALEPPIIGNDSVTLDNLYVGSNVEVKDSGSPDGSGAATGSSNWIQLAHHITASSDIRATQKLCSSSNPSKPTKPTNTIPPPELVAPICPDQKSASVDNSTINATLVLLKNGSTVIGYGGAGPGEVPLDIAPPNAFTNGEDVQVAEYLGSDVVLSNSVVVGCSKKAKVIDMIPISQSAETNQDSEVFLSVNGSNHKLMVGSAFTPTQPKGTSAPIFVSQDDGNTWTMNFVVPVGPIVPRFGTLDITHAFAGSGNKFYVGRLTSCNSGSCPNFPTEFDEQETNDVTSGATLTIQASRFNVDQPFTRATTVGGSDRIYMGNNDFNDGSNSGSVDVSPSDGSSYNTTQLDSRSPVQDGPSMRPTIAKDGTIYIAFLSWTNTSVSPCGNSCTLTVDVVVVRDDSGGVGSNPFQALTDPNDGNVGNRVRTGISIPWSNKATLGQERTGSTLSLAVDPNKSGRVFIAWADNQVKSGNYTIHVRESTDRGQSWSSSDLFTAQNALNCALAVDENGTVGLLFQQHTGSGGPGNPFGGNWVTHLIQTTDSFTHTQDTILARTPSAQPGFNFLPYLGDYVNLIAVGTEFRGIFTANNTPSVADFPSGVVFQRVANFSTQTLETSKGLPVNISIDPFYFSVPALR